MQPKYSLTEDQEEHLRSTSHFFNVSSFISESLQNSQFAMHASLYSEPGMVVDEALFSLCLSFIYTAELELSDVREACLLSFCRDIATEMSWRNRSYSRLSGTSTYSSLSC